MEDPTGNILRTIKTVFCTENAQPNFVNEILRFRKRVFVDRLGWDLKVNGGIERDEFDTHEAVHGAIVEDGAIVSCFRLIRTDKPYLAAEKFDLLAQSRPFPRSSRVWEISRLAVSGSARPFEIMLYTYSAIFNFAFAQGATSLVAFADIAKERLVTRIGITTDLIGQPTEIGMDAHGHPIVCVAGELPLHLQTGPKFERLLNYFQKTEIEDGNAFFGRQRISA